MKNSKALRLLCAGVVASTVSVSANAWSFFKFGGADKPKPTITEIVAKSGNGFDHRRYDNDILLAAVQAAGLAETLASEKIDVTVFAPSDAAFLRLARDFGYEGNSEEGAFNAIFATLLGLTGGDEDAAIDILRNILLYHVAPESRSKFSVIYDGEVPTLLDGASILPVGLQLIDNDPEFKNPKLSFWKRGTKASNGIVHSISRVLIPLDLPAAGQSDLPTIAGTAIAVSSLEGVDSNPNDFDILLQGILAVDAGKAAGEGLVDILSTVPSLTVFAPTDAAFIQLVKDLGVNVSTEQEALDVVLAALPGLTGLDLATALETVITYHVTVGAGDTALTLKDLLVADEIDTVLGPVIKPDGRTLGDIETRVADPELILRAGNILTSNGRIHPIDRVLLPAELNL